MSFNKYIDFYFEFKQTELKKSSLHKYKGILNNYIYPYFGGLTPKEANNMHNIRQFLLSLNDMSLKGTLSSKTIKDIIMILGGCLQEAFYDEQIEKNNITLLRSIKAIKPNINPFARHEVKLLLQNSTGWFNVFLSIAFYTGMRTGEILALHTRDIDLDNSIIHVNKTRGKFGVSTPKTISSIRDIPTFKPLKIILIDYLKTHDNEYLFVNQYSNPFNSSKNINLRYFRPLLKLCGLSYRRLYETRHTFATNMLESGKFSVNEIARFMGHSNTQMIFNRYTAYIESEKRKNKNSVDIYS
ncbi:MAG: site-specific integrase [Campylobacteraceae bacterium]|jgi:integrase|nr:site-specific integrase [Campylobacteraceae bacterium]